MCVLIVSNGRPVKVNRPSAESASLFENKPSKKNISQEIPRHFPVRFLSFSQDVGNQLESISHSGFLGNALPSNYEMINLSMNSILAWAVIGMVLK